MKIESIKGQVFTFPSRRTSDSAGHSHPSDTVTQAKLAMLTLTAEDGTAGRVLAPVEVIRPFVINSFGRKVLIGQDPMDRERLWHDLEHWQRGSAGQLTERALAAFDQALCCLLYTSPSPRDLSTSRMPSSA